MKEQELKTIIDRIDWTWLEKHLSGLIGQDVKLTIGIVNGLNGPMINIESQELVEFSGVMKTVFSTLKLRDYGVTHNDEEHYFCVPIDWAWRYKEGGSNGFTLCRAFYFQDSETWEAR